MNWMDVPFIDYLNAVDDILEARYGVTSDDVNLTLISAGQENGEEPAACAESIADKYELDTLQGEP